MIQLVFILFLLGLLTREYLLYLFLLFRFHYIKHDKDIVRSIRSMSYFLFGIAMSFLWQKTNYCVREIDKHRYEVTYFIHFNCYKFIVSYKKGPSRYLQFINEKDHDITDIVTPFLGPNDDFHNIPYTPSDFGCEELTINFSDGQTRLIKKEESIL